jgi:hypothetical protein
MVTVSNGRKSAPTMRDVTLCEQAFDYCHARHATPRRTAVTLSYWPACRERVSWHYGGE